ncbi:TIGR01212 family radical SAM protein [candidate division KSB3 bacterium]|uniref:TIGR01212 family radical SAM protein n=1 Tax=candidate division KSB3 bacterium TaxID=2044937 RepID=A0A2G6KEZ4_9BACT|nr:MAG: TIGR01212 family radical SAM protein [candidate division KSB3 bacterium]
MRPLHERKRYFTFNRHLRDLFGERVYKISIDAGLTCPNRDGFKGNGGCIYCYGDRSVSQPIEKTAMLDSMRIGWKAVHKKYKADKFLVYFQSYTNTYAPLDVLEDLYTTALAEEYIVGISIGTRPDCVDEPVLDLLGTLAQQHYLWVEYGLQSVHERTLQLIKRGHTYDDFLDALYRTQQRPDIKTCVHVILGLPGETKDDMLETADTLSQLGIQGVKIHSAHVLKNTPLEELYRQGNYRPMELEEYVETVCDFLEHLSPDIIIHRVIGDAPRKRYVAPEWCLHKSESVTQIDLEFERRRTYQGSRFKTA